MYNENVLSRWSIRLSSLFDRIKWIFMLGYKKVHMSMKGQTSLKWFIAVCKFYLSGLLGWWCCCCSVKSNSWRPNGLQHARLPCPSPSPRACSNSCPSSQWCHPTISSSVIPFCFQSFPPSGSFLMSQPFTSSGQSTELQHQFFKWIFRVGFL